MLNSCTHQMIPREVYPHPPFVSQHKMVHSGVLSSAPTQNIFNSVWRGICNPKMNVELQQFKQSQLVELEGFMYQFQSGLPGLEMAQCTTAMHKHTQVALNPSWQKGTTDVNNWGGRLKQPPHLEKSGLCNRIITNLRQYTKTLTSATKALEEFLSPDWQKPVYGRNGASMWKTKHSRKNPQD